MPNDFTGGAGFSFVVNISLNNDGAFIIKTVISNRLAGINTSLKRRFVFFDNFMWSISYRIAFSNALVYFYEFLLQKQYVLWRNALRKIRIFSVNLLPVSWYKFTSL
jgi:hypothetical protein